MESRRQFLIALGASFLLAGCGGSGNGQVSAPEITPEQKAAGDELKANVLKSMKKGR